MFQAQLSAILLLILFFGIYIYGAKLGYSYAEFDSLKNLLD